MTGLDKNVVIRYLTHDNPAQSSAADRLMRSFSPEAPGFLSLVVMVETIWVLESSYNFKRHQIKEVLETLLRSKEWLLNGQRSPGRHGAHLAIAGLILLTVSSNGAPTRLDAHTLQPSIVPP
jgi:predicted nucleic-acid-binding protein